MGDLLPVPTPEAAITNLLLLTSAQSCLTLCNPHAQWLARLLCPMGFTRKEYWSG